MEDDDDWDVTAVVVRMIVGSVNNTKEPKADESTTTAGVHDNT